MSGPLVIGHDN